MNPVVSWVRHACQAVPIFNPKAGMTAGSVIHRIDGGASPFLADRQLAVAVQTRRHHIGPVPPEGGQGS